MSDDIRKVPIIILSVSFVLIVFIGIALLFNWPGQQAARLPATSTVNPASVSIGEAWVNPALNAASGTTAETAALPGAAAATSGTDTIAAATTGEAATDTQAAQNTGDNGLYIVYGENPDPATFTGTGSTAAPPASGSSAPAAAASASTGSSGTAAKPYTPAPSTPTRSTAPSASTSTRPASSAAGNASAASSSTAPAVPRTEYWIQAASLTSRSRAEDLQASLISSGLSAIINIHEVDGTPWYRVRIGPYQSRNEADGWLGNIKKLPGCAEAYISEVTVRS